MPLPTDPISIIILTIDILFEVQDRASAYTRLASGISAKAEEEGRDVTDDEMQLIKFARDESAKRRKGQ